MEGQKKYDIFISYSRKDFDEVNALVNYLKQAIPDLTYWFDLTGIESGDDFEDRIITAIDNSAFVLFALSDNSMQSSWTKDEVMYAKNTGKRVLPVLMKGAVLSDGWFLFKFGRVDCIDSAKSLQMDKLVRNLSQWTQKPMAILPKSNVSESKPSDQSKARVSKTSMPKRFLWMIASALLLVLLVVFFASRSSGKYEVREENEVVSEAVVPETKTTSHPWVDLGLSVMWASCNVGAEEQHDAGHYYAWGETQIPESNQWSSYVHGAAPDKLTKYCNDANLGWNAYTDNKKVLDAEDDAATVHWGKDWRMPTIKEMEELRKKCTWIWTNENGVSGYYVVGKNGNSIFLPAAGSLNGDKVNFKGDAGFYWCRNLSLDNSRYAYSMGFNKSEVSFNGDAFRLSRRSIRPVCRKSVALKKMSKK